MAYRYNWAIWGQIISFRGTEVVLLTDNFGDNAIHNFPKGISLKINVIVQLDVELV